MSIDLDAKPARNRWKTAREITANSDEAAFVSILRLCPVCDQDIPIRPDGGLYPHHINGEPPVKCNGDQLAPRYERDVNAAPSADELADLAARGRAGFATIADDAPVLPEGWGEVNEPPSRRCDECGELHENCPCKDNPHGKLELTEDGGVRPRTIAVTAYGPDGESIVVEQAIPYYETKDGAVVDPPRAAGDWSASTPVIKITLPGFDAPIDVDIVKLNFTGNIELDIVGDEHRAIWNALRWKGMVTLVVQAKVRDLALQERTGDRAQATLKILSVTRPEAARNPYEEGDEDETVCDRCGENPAIDGLYCGACIEVMEAEDAEETPAAETRPGILIGECQGCGKPGRNRRFNRCTHCRGEAGEILVFGLCGHCEGYATVENFESPDFTCDACDADQNRTDHAPYDLDAALADAGTDGAEA